jgi:predicted ATPase
MQKIKITNFKAIKSAEIEIKKSVFLIGEQASGKSTVAKLVYFFKSLKDEYLEVISENLEELNLSKDIQFRLGDAIKKRFYRFFGAIQHLPPFEIQYMYSETKILTLRQEERIESRKSLDIHFSAVFYRNIIEDVLPTLKTLRQVSARRDFYTSSTYRAELEKLNQYAETLFEEERRLVFIPAGRNITVTYPDFFRFNFTGSLSSDLALIKDEEDITTRFVQDTYLMLQFLRRVQTLMDTYKGITFHTLLEQIPSGKKRRIQKYADLALEKIKQILKGTYKFDGVFGEQILFNETEYVHLSNASSGQQEVIRILQDLFLIIVNHESAFRVIEEPEAHLFPTAQKRLLETIALMLKATPSQIFITTHSPYILSVVTNLLFASSMGENYPIPIECQLVPKDTAVYALVNGKSQSILDSKTGVIDQNVLDAISEELAGEFDLMYTKRIEKGA